MAIVNVSIPSLTNGVSQQAAALRAPSQGELQDNAWPSLIDGLTLRPPTEHVAKMRSGTVTDAYVHKINRDATERYVVFVINGDLEVYDLLTGAAKTVTFPDGKTYLTAATPSTMFSLTTVADYTFVVNTTKVVAMGAVSGGALAGTVQTFDKLPATPVLNDIWKITGNATNQFDNYYVQWNGTVWVETVKPGLFNAYDATTMPHRLVRNADTTWTFSKVTWANRLTCDEVISPQGAFVGRKISNVFFHRNRLGISADESAVFSRAGGFFNLFRSTATTILDTDPVHTAVSHEKVSIIRHAVPFNKALVLFSDQTQFVMTAGDTLTPNTPKIDPATEFECSALARPIGVGSNLYFAVDRGTASSVREYYVDKDTVSNDAADITAHVPTYIPQGITKIDASTAEDCVFVKSNTSASTIYAYKFYWNGDTKIQSAWGKWTFPATDNILSFGCIGTFLYLVVQRSDGVFLDKVNLQQQLIDADVGFRVHLDRRVLLTGVYNSSLDITTWTLPYIESAPMRVVMGSAFTGQKGNRVVITRPTTSTIQAVGNYAAGTCYVGRNYVMRYRFSEQFYRDANNGAILDGRLQHRRLLVQYKDSGPFSVEVTPKARPVSTYKWSGKLLGDSTLIIGTPALGSGTFTAPILAKSDHVTIDLVVDSYMPVSFQSAEFVSEFTPKSKRV